MSAPSLYFPPDVEESHQRFGATCGHVAFAALVGRPVAEIVNFFPALLAERRSWTNLRMMKAALQAAGVSGWQRERAWPRRGVVLLQIIGPWCAPGVPAAAALRHTHWVCAEDRWVFDGNAAFLGLPPWLERERWEREIMALLCADTRRATGEYAPRTCLDLLPRVAAAGAPTP